MTPASYRCSSPPSWYLAKPPSDPAKRRMIHGPIQPMQEERVGFFRRLFRLH